MKRPQLLELRAEAREAVEAKSAGLPVHIKDQMGAAEREFVTAFTDYSRSVNRPDALQHLDRTVEDTADLLAMMSAASVLRCRVVCPHAAADQGGLVYVDLIRGVNACHGCAPVLMHSLRDDGRCSLCDEPTAARYRRGTALVQGPKVFLISVGPCCLPDIASHVPAALLLPDETGEKR